MFDVCLLLNLYNSKQLQYTAQSLAEQVVIQNPEIPSPLGVSALVLCGTLLSCFGQGGAVD